MLKYQLKQEIYDCLCGHGYSLEKNSVEFSRNTKYADYSSNLAFSLTKVLKKSPQLIAQELAGVLSGDPVLFKQYSFSAMNGFINIRLLDAFLWRQFISDQATHSFPKFPHKILLEYVSANPTGPLHIGHGRWAVIGNVLTRLFQHIGVDVRTEFYVNNAGNQVHLFYESIQAVRDNKPIPEGGYHGDYIVALAKQDTDPLQAIIMDQKNVLARMGIPFDCWFYESRLHETKALEKIISLLKQKEVTYEQDGALWFKSSLFGDEKDRVLIKEDGKPTYFVVDIAYHLDKLDRGFDYLINIWGADHHGYVARVKAALQVLAQDRFQVQSHFQVIIGQLVSLFRNGEPVRMSKRTGDMITLSEVLDEIGVDATRFFLVYKHQDIHLDFDLELAKKQSQENPVYYIQYAHARICSILKKLESSGLTISAQLIDETIVFDEYERTLIMQSLQLPEEIYEAAWQMSPSKIAYFAIELSKNFHAFYEHCPILKADSKTQIYRHILIQKVRDRLRLCFELLGVSAPEKM